MYENCVILAGGKSSRMGRDKALLPFENFHTLTHFQVFKFSKIFKNVFVSSKFDKFNGEFKLIKDTFNDFSPMGGLYSVLSNFKNQNVFIIAVDMPFVKFETINLLYENLGKNEICVAKDKEHIHNLCGFYNSNLSDLALSLYEKNIHKIKALFQKSKFKSVFFDDEKEFLNLNYFDEYEKAIKKGILWKK